MKLLSFLFLCALFISALVAFTYAQDPKITFYAYAPAGTALNTASLSVYVVEPLVSTKSNEDGTSTTVPVCFPHPDKDVVAYCRVLTPSDVDGEDDITTYALCTDTTLDNTTLTPPCYETGLVKDIITAQCSSVLGNITTPVVCPIVLPVDDATNPANQAENDVANMKFCDATTLKAYNDIVVAYTVKIAPVEGSSESTDESITLPTDGPIYTPDDKVICPVLTCDDDDSSTTTTTTCDDIIKTLVCSDDKTFNTPLDITCTTPSGLVYKSSDVPQDGQDTTNYTTICGQYIPQSYQTCTPRYWVCSYTKNDYTTATQEACLDTYTIPDTVPCVEKSSSSNTTDDNNTPLQQDTDDTTPPINDEDDTYDGEYTRYVFCSYNNIENTTNECDLLKNKPTTTSCSLDDRVFISSITSNLDDNTIPLNNNDSIILTIKSIYYNVIDKAIIELRPVENKTDNDDDNDDDDTTIDNIAHTYSIDITEYIQSQLVTTPSLNSVDITIKQVKPTDDNTNDNDGNDDTTPVPFTLLHHTETPVSIVLDNTTGIATPYLDASKYTVVVITTPRPKEHGETHDDEEPVEYVALFTFEIKNQCVADLCNGFGCTVEHICNCPSGSKDDTCADVVCTASEIEACGATDHVEKCYKQESTTPPGTMEPKCICKDGWEGAKCSVATCTSSQIKACGNNALRCELIEDNNSADDENVDPDQDDGDITPKTIPHCVCNTGWEGDYCTDAVCTTEQQTACGEHGTCIMKEATTPDDGSTDGGNDDDDDTNDSDTFMLLATYEPICKCDSGYTGQYCDQEKVNPCDTYTQCTVSPFVECIVDDITELPSCACVSSSSSSSAPSKCKNGSTAIVPRISDDTPSGDDDDDDSSSDSDDNDQDICGCQCLTSQPATNWILEKNTGDDCGCSILYSSIQVLPLLQLDNKDDVETWYNELKIAFATAANVDTNLVVLYPTVEQLISTNKSNTPYASPNINDNMSTSTNQIAYLTFGIISCADNNDNDSSSDESDSDYDNNDTIRTNISLDYARYIYKQLKIASTQSSSTHERYSVFYTVPQYKLAVSGINDVQNTLLSASSSLYRILSVNTDSASSTVLTQQTNVEQFQYIYRSCTDNSTECSESQFSPYRTWAIDNGQDPDANDKNNDDNKSHTTAIVLGVIFGIIGLIIIIAIVYYCCCVGKHNKKQQFPGQYHDSQELTYLEHNIN